MCSLPTDFLHAAIKRLRLGQADAVRTSSRWQGFTSKKPSSCLRLPRFTGDGIDGELHEYIILILAAFAHIGTHQSGHYSPAPFDTKENGWYTCEDREQPVAVHSVPTWFKTMVMMIRAVRVQDTNFHLAAPFEPSQMDTVLQLYAG